MPSHLGTAPTISKPNIIGQQTDIVVPLERNVHKKNINMVATKIRRSSVTSKIEKSPGQ